MYTRFRNNYYSQPEQTESHKLLTNCTQLKEV